ncbi:hypothetical protein DV738_g5333, partial [Chaetothyriales sp. CBS 135597]
MLPKTYPPYLRCLRADKIRQCTTCKADFTSAFAIPRLWWEEYCRKANGYFGCLDTVDEHGAMSGIRTWCRFLVKQACVADRAKSYEWYKLNLFTAWDSSTLRAVMLLFDLPPSMAQTLPHRLLDRLDHADRHSQFGMYVPLLDEVASLQHCAVWTIRTLVRNLETDRTSVDRPSPDYEHLHDLARHAIHVSETLDLASNTIDGILAHHHSVSNRLLFYQDMIRGLRLRSTSNRERLQNEIALAFNSVAQYDARISLGIGHAARADSAAMRTIAFVTLVFLPPTFICAIFSMSFFDYDSGSSGSGQWQISPDFWLYWAVAIPVTVCTVLLWLAWTNLIHPMPASVGGSSGAEKDGL